MKRFILAAGVAALAITAAPATAERGGQGGGHKSHAAKADRGGGGKARAAKADRRGGGQARAAKMERRGGSKERLARADRPQMQRFASMERKSNRGEVKARGRDNDRIRSRDLDRKQQRAVAKLRDRDDNRVLRNRDRNDDRVRLVDRDRNIVRIRDFDDNRFDRRIAARGLMNGCPPGLWKRDNDCTPPGQMKNRVGQRYSNAYRASALPLALRDLYRDDDDYYYRYGNGYLYKVDRESQMVNSLLPLIGAGLGLGQVFPSTYANAYVPNYYRSFYPDTQDDYYRYANGYVYEIDRGSGMIENMIPLMAGGYGIGQMLPAGYSAYNVPYQYRDLYYDTDDYSYRYAPGAIYQVDPQSQLITSVASLLSPNGFMVGQQLPAGYGAYNVPYAYRDQYYDTADNWYRYNNGSIYQVDPTTQLITAIIRAIV